MRDEDIDPRITDLINEARSWALTQSAGPVHRSEQTRVFATIAGDVKRALLCQVVDGKWAEWGVTAPWQFLELRVTVTMGGLAGPPLRIQEDFSRTPLRFLEVKSVVSS